MNDYNDIINLPFKKSDKYPHMSVRDRAAQFAPFSALTGYSDTVSEVERQTGKERILDEYEIAEIDKALQFIAENINLELTATLTYFIPDTKKNGGEYHTLNAVVTFVDDLEKELILLSGEHISFDKIVSIYVE